MSTMTSRPVRDQVAAAFGAARRESGFGLRDLAGRCGVSRSHIADIETGRSWGAPDLLDRMATALGADISVTLRRPVLVGPNPKRGGSQDAGHAWCIEVAHRELVRHRLLCATEVHVETPGAHGWIDLLAFEPSIRRLIVIEFKTELRDLGGLDRQLDVYARGCLAAARARGWQPSEVLIVTVLLATTENDAVVAAHRSALKGSFPMRGRAALEAVLDGGPLTGRGLLMIDPVRNGRRAFTSCRVDGRRTDAPYEDYADFMRAVRSTNDAGDGGRGRR
jgi:transcriptional regulator with XRE-family HTH domain